MDLRGAEQEPAFLDGLAPEPLRPARAAHCHARCPCVPQAQTVYAEDADGPEPGSPAFSIPDPPRNLAKDMGFPPLYRWRNLERLVAWK